MTRYRREGLVWAVFLAHLGALVFGLVGILYVIPNLADFAGNRRAMEVYTWSIDNAGATHILLGAATMLLVGFRAIGVTRTLVFFAASTTISLSSEWLGTTHGIPFGNYQYTNFLGYKIDGHVPYSIPLSWFYIGFACSLLASVIVSALNLRPRTLWTLGLGVWFLTVWDLVLDPAMAHESLTIKFWIWEQSGAYFGMPIRNFVGWSVTGLIYMGVARLIWRHEPAVAPSATLLPLAVYVANMVFAMVLSISVGLWFPVVLAAVLGVLPAAYTLLVRPRADERPAGVAPSWRPSSAPR
ncbi:MAG: carotenoid biosynthesis protein [Thermomicrobiales bacterium]|nr:carotenoid biosynthesis protein [Thermomicrobiales bacterium]